MIIPAIVLTLLLGLVGGAYITNPFSRFTIVKQPFTIQVMLGAFRSINNNHKLHVAQAPLWRLFATLKVFVHMLETRYAKSPRSKATTIDGIIAEIHKQRFNPNNLLLTSGDHWSGLFSRNLGVFYYPMCDPRIASEQEDWHNRQVVYLQTLAYALGVFEKRPIPVTTIVTTGKYRATCMNFWRYPSDTVYGLLFGLATLLGKQDAAPHAYATAQHHSDSGPAAQLLFSEYNATLRKLYEHYRTTVFDEDAMLLRRDLVLCGAKDVTRRQGAFYDNVVFWKTTQLAMQLGLISDDQSFLRRLKRSIIKTYWLEDKGYFLEELSETGIREAHYSSDWLQVLITGFLDPAKESEQTYFIRSIEYIQKAGVDKPFALKYQAEAGGRHQFFLPRISMASYQQDAIWSHWGMEYIKTLLLLYQYTGKQLYLHTADRHIKAYEKAMLRDGGYPELYDQDGKFFETPVVRSIRLTGWVIGFEQVKAMREALA
ncbi:MAG TPA: hypothetical protein VMB52_02690 [Verrucomicrobiae bacterium]|nr:hypothetical protein [Verrucomicrobiae bacterium]